MCLDENAENTSIVKLLPETHIQNQISATIRHYDNFSITLYNIFPQKYYQCIRLMLSIECLSYGIGTPFVERNAERFVIDRDLHLYIRNKSKLRIGIQKYSDIYGNLTGWAIVSIPDGIMSSCEINIDYYAYRDETVKTESFIRNAIVL